ncbi:MAG: hypothetical protein GXO31_03845 [Epsilonproteobacteria bacterium]|nr:hypothetical protein [Campylobacterota bacterium]
MSKFLKYYHTLKYLKPTQIKYRIYYLGRNKIRKIRDFRYPLSLPSQSVELRLDESIASLKSFSKENGKYCFDFLNLSHCFDNEIDWNFSKFGKLWAYNLNYFNYLLQKDILKEDGVDLIYKFIDDIESNREGLEPYPISLRGINWIKFLTYNKIKDKKIDDSLFAQYMILADNLEFHVLGNHILENGFSLLFGAYYFKDENLYKLSKSIIEEELREEILKDGAHFELSPMYHQLILFRVLDALNLVKNNNLFEDSLESILREKAEIMLSWLNNITFRNGEIPFLNDSAPNIAPITKELNEYAKRIGVEFEKKVGFKDSGYRKFVVNNCEMIFDVGRIGPDYIPGHAHSDTFNFVLYFKNKPLIVDTGVSTYENNEIRFFERSTAAHNTVKIGDYEQSEIWSSFRVARRAKIISLIEKENFIEASHDGYERIGYIHKRRFEKFENKIIIQDFIEKREDAKNDLDIVSYLHFHPDVKVILRENSIFADDLKISIEGAEKMEIDDYFYAKGYNRLVRSKVALIYFKNKCKMEFICVDR